MKAFLIATGGIRAGKAVPLELATDGMLEVELPPNFEVLRGVWTFPEPPRLAQPRRKKNAIVHVTGCRMTASTTAPAVVPKTTVFVVGCAPDDEALIVATVQAALEQMILERIVAEYSCEAPDEREILLSGMEDLQDQVERLQAEVQRLKNP